MADLAQTPLTTIEDAPPGPALRAWNWARANLFNSLFNAILTLLIVIGVVRVVWPLLRWAVVDASRSAANDKVCQAAGGACWAFLGEWGRFVLFGRFPYDQQWRPALV